MACDRTCATCRHWAAAAMIDAEDMGLCRHNPPHYEGWSITLDRDWCGEWSARQGAGPAACPPGAACAQGTCALPRKRSSQDGDQGLARTEFVDRTGVEEAVSGQHGRPLAPKSQPGSAAPGSAFPAPARRPRCTSLAAAVRPPTLPTAPQSRAAARARRSGSPAIRGILQGGTWSPDVRFRYLRRSRTCRGLSPDGPCR